MAMSELGRRCVRRSGIVQRLGVLADGLLDEGFPVLGIVELDVSVGKSVFGGQSHSDEVADAWRSVVAVLKRCIDPFEEFSMAFLGIHETDAELSHWREYGVHCHKTTGKLVDLGHLVQSAPCIDGAQSYNTLDDKEESKRSVSVLGNVPGNVPGWRLGLTRFAETSMKRYESLHQEATGGIALETLADARRAA